MSTLCDAGTQPGGCYPICVAVELLGDACRQIFKKGKVLLRGEKRSPRRKLIPASKMPLKKEKKVFLSFQQTVVND